MSETRVESLEDDLVRRFRSGDTGAFEGVVHHFHPRLQELAFRMTGDAEEAREIGQMALVRAWEALASFGGRARLSTWLYRVVLNLCRDRHRKRTAREDHVFLVEASEETSDRRDLPEAASADREAWEVVAEAVRALPVGEREVVLLRHYHDLKFVEIAEIRGEPVTTVKSRMNKGLQLLRSRLKDLES